MPMLDRLYDYILCRRLIDHMNRAFKHRLRFLDDGSETLDWLRAADLTPLTHSVFATKAYQVTSH